MFIASGLRVYYKFEAGDRTFDSSGYLRTSVEIGPPTYDVIFWLGRTGGAVVCEAANTLNIPWSVFDGLSSFTIAWHVQPTVSDQPAIIFIDGDKLSVVATPAAVTVKIGDADPLVCPPLPLSLFDPAAVSSVIMTRSVVQGHGTLQFKYNGQLVAGYGIACSADSLPTSIAAVRLSGRFGSAAAEDATLARWSEIAVWDRVISSREQQHEAAYGLVATIEEAVPQSVTGVAVAPVRPDFLSTNYYDEITNPGAGEPISVDQPSGGGSLYPFIAETPFFGLVADLHLSYSDVLCELMPPFRLETLLVSGRLVDDTLDEHPNVVDAVIVDANGYLVFDTRNDSVTFNAAAWGGRMDIYTWASKSLGRILRIVMHKPPVNDLNAFPPVRNDNLEFFPPEITSETAWLDMRACEPRTLHVESFRGFGSDYNLDNIIVLKNGYNTLWEQEEAVVDASGRSTTALTLHANPGDGAGRFPTDCHEENLVIKTINGVAPDEHGRFRLGTDGCQQLTQPIAVTLGSDVVLRRDQIVINGAACKACCTCEDYANTYEGIRRLRNHYANLVVRAGTVRDIYAANIARFEAEAARRRKDLLRMGARPFCPDDLSVTIGFCNSSETCLTGLVIPISFEYFDTAGDIDPLTQQGFLASTIYNAIDLDIQQPQILANTCFRSGEAQCELTAGALAASQQFYELGGSYPHFYAAWEQVDPGAMAVISFTIRFTDSLATDRVEIISDAYSVASGSVPLGGGMSADPIPGYVFGSGPMTPEAKAARIITGPKKISVGLLQDC